MKWEATVRIDYAVPSYGRKPGDFVTQTFPNREAAIEWIEGKLVKGYTTGSARPLS